jgi:hypothetical protein
MDNECSQSPELDEFEANRITSVFIELSLTLRFVLLSVLVFWVVVPAAVRLSVGIAHLVSHGEQLDADADTGVVPGFLLGAAGTPCVSWGLLALWDRKRWRERSDSPAVTQCDQ